LQINTGHELVLTELILENFLSGYEPHEVVALLASFVFQERRSETEPVLTDRLKEVRRNISCAWPS
jgi:antiviral helicase SKI2